MKGCKMDLGIKDRVVMIAAGSKGLGRASALALAKEGCRVSFCGRSIEPLHEATQALLAAGCAEQNILALRADITKAQEVKAWFDETIQRFGQVDIAITNTGGPKAARFEALSEEDWRAGIDSTLMNVIQLCQLVIPGMKQRQWGRIIHITSFVAKEPEEDLTISSTLRAGISALTRTLARQLGPHQITVNAVLPGHTMTDRQLHLAEIRGKNQGITPEEYLQKAAAQIPLRRIARPEEFGAVVAFLSSENASYLSGVSLPIDGGLLRSAL
jgi:3-oxoacyl-[acyl-carrier protein] reductase